MDENNLHDSKVVIDYKIADIDELESAIEKLEAWLEKRDKI